MFLAFYRNDFMHNILPLEDGPTWCFILLILVSTALVTAEFTKLRREEGKFAFELLVLVAAVLVSFPRQMSYEYTFLLLALALVYFVMGMRFLLNMQVGGEYS